LSQNEFSQTSLYKEYPCFNFSNFPIYPPGFSNLCSLFPRAHAFLPTVFGVKQGGRVGKGEGVGCSLLEPEQSTEIGVAGWLGGAGDPSSILLYYWYGF